MEHGAECKHCRHFQSDCKISSNWLSSCQMLTTFFFFLFFWAWGTWGALWVSLGGSARLHVQRPWHQLQCLQLWPPPSGWNFCICSWSRRGYFPHFRIHCLSQWVSRVVSPFSQAPRWRHHWGMYVTEKFGGKCSVCCSSLLLYACMIKCVWFTLDAKHVGITENVGGSQYL